MPQEGSLVKGYIINISYHKGCFVRLSNKHVGRILIKDMSDHYIPEPDKIYPVGTLVTARVISADPNSQNIVLNMKASVIGNDDNHNSAPVVGSGTVFGANDSKMLKEISALSVGDIITGTVKKIADFGVFVAIKGLSVVGLSRVGTAAPVSVTDLNTVYSVGDIVRGKILDINGPKVSIGLKNSYFTEGGSESDDDNEDEELAEGDEDIDDNDEIADDNEEEEDNDDDVEDEDDEEEVASGIQDTSMEMEEFNDENSADYVDVDDEIVVKKSKFTPIKQVRSSAVDVEEEDDDEEEVIVKPVKRAIKSSLFQWDDVKPTSNLGKTEEDNELEENKIVVESTKNSKVKQKAAKADDLDLFKKEVCRKGFT